MAFHHRKGSPVHGFKMLRKSSPRFNLLWQLAQSSGFFVHSVAFTCFAPPSAIAAASGFELSSA